LSTSFFLTVCLGGILCLTPVSIYLFWLSSLNRKATPTVVSATWEFAGLVTGLGGFLFCTGIVLAAAMTDSGLLTQGPLGRLSARLPVWLPWSNLVWFFGLSIYMLLLVRAIRRGWRLRSGALAVFHVDRAVLEALLDEAFLAIGRPVAQHGHQWRDGPTAVADVIYFHAFAHGTVQLLGPESERVSVERHLRTAVERLPAARHNPAALWIGAACTCSIVAIGCCVVLIFAIPFVA
jgi:hypothetical protein